MKAVAAISVLFVVAFFTHCKKNNTPQPTDNDTDTLAPGRYIIRTKYKCDGKAFLLGSFSNHEFISWQQNSPEQIQDIKNDKPYDKNTFIWTVGPALTHGGTVAPAPIAVAGSIRVFTIYQEAEGGIKWYLPTPGPGPHVDNTGFDLGPSYFGGITTYDDAELSTLDIPAAYFSVTDSTGRISAWSQPYWFYLAIPGDTDDACDEFNHQVIWRNGWLCPNTTVMGDAWKADACSITQVVFEKVD